MPSQLKISIGQYSDRGRKETNQDFHGAYIPKEPQLTSKGVVVALADGISSSTVSAAASETAVKSLLEDYYCTSEAWSVKKSAQRVLTAANSWLFAQTQQSPYRYEKDRGYVCTLSALIIKSTTAHLFHVGDARIYRLHANALEQLTNDHRIRIAEHESHLSRAFGVHSQLDIDYQSLQLEIGDIFVLATDGVYEFLGGDRIVDALQEYASDLDGTARAIAGEAYRCGSDDNLTIQIVRIDELPEQTATEAYQTFTALPFPPALQARMSFDGYRIVRELHASARSHIYLALDEETQTSVVLKTPSIDLRGDPAYLERFLMEEWIAQRIDSPYVLKPCARTRKRNYLYIATEYIDGQTLTQWMVDHPRPSLEEVRGIIQQIAKGLLAFHRLEMLHQDLRPENIMIDRTGTVKIIDFGATRVAGILEIATPIERHELLGTAQYSAPEYFLGESGTPRSDLFSLGVIAYQMLSGKLPYGVDVAKTRTTAEQRNLRYRSLLDENPAIPPWIDEVIKKAVHPDPQRRYEELSEFTHELRQPNQAYLAKTRPPLIERNPVRFWKGVSFILAIVVIILLIELRSS